MKIRPISRSPLRPTLRMFRQSPGNPPSRTRVLPEGRTGHNALSEPDRRAINRAENEGMGPCNPDDEPARRA